MAEFRFRKSERLLKRQDFLSLADNGKVCHSRYFLGVFGKYPDSTSYGRIGITVSKKVGNAVVRNRIKRLVREYIRINRPLSKNKLDLNINIIAKKNCSGQDSKEIFKSLSILFRKIGDLANG